MDAQSHRTHTRRHGHHGSSQHYQTSTVITYGSPRRSSASQQNGNNHSSPQHRSSHSNGSMYTSSSPSHAASRQDTEYYYWQAVPRSWESEDPQGRRSTTDERLQSDPYASPRFRSHTYGHSSQGFSHQNSNSNTQNSQPTPDHTSGRLTLSDLQRLDRDRTPITNMTLWKNENQRESPWIGVGYVRIEREDGRRNSPS